jgi:hypothetical protein
MDPHIIISGSNPQPTEPPSPTGGVAFRQADFDQQVRGLHASARVRPEDVLVGNPEHRPFVTVIPILPHPFSVDLQHVIIFTRAPNLTEALGRTPIIWEKFIKPIHFPPQSDFTGVPMAKALDEEDWVEYLKSCLRAQRDQPHKYKLVALGRGSFPHTFCPLWLLEDFKDMCSFEVDNRKDVVA